jgi:DNA repair exonuclease SbcCD ATPase subunit
MASLLKNLLGDGSKNREFAEDLRALLQEMRQERERFAALLHHSRAAAERLDQLGEPIARVGSDVDAVRAGLRDLEQRLEAFAPISALIQALDERSAGLAQNQQQAETHFATVLDDSQHIRAVFEELSQKVDLAASLKEGLEAFLEVDKPFQVLRDEASALRGQVEGTGEHLGRLREQHERLMDAHKLAMSKMEALDRRRDELSRDLQDKERRVVGVDQAVRGMDGVRQTVDAVKRELGTLKVLGDSLAQKTSALEAQREAVDRALSQADGLERSMRQIDAGIRQQQENEKSLSAMQDAVAALKSLQEQVLDRSSEITQIQRQTEEQTGIIRHELTAAQDEMKNAVERFDFEGKGLESVSQRVADLRGALADFEHRFKELRESSQSVCDLNSQTDALTTQVHGLQERAAHLDGDVKTLHAIRRDLDEADRKARDLGAQVARIEEARPAVDAVLVDLEVLSRTHAMVTDSLEQTQVAQGELTRMRESQSKTRSWLTGVERSLDELRSQVGELQDMGPSLEIVQAQTQRISESMSSIESRREFVEALHRQVAEIGALGADLDERGRQLRTRMDAAEQRFVDLAAHAEEAERVSKTVAGVTSSVREAARQAAATGKAVAAAEARCESVEGIAESARALREELDQREHALEEAARKLQQASKLRQEAAASAQQLDELAGRLGAALTSADERAASVAETSARLEDRVADLQVVDERLDQFEERLSNWELVDQAVSRSLDQISARQGTVQTLRSDLDRMSTMAEKTSSDVRAITSASREIAESRGLLDQVMGRLKEIHGATDELDERRRQMTLAEERLARAEGFLVDVRSSLEALQGQKAIVEQAVEKAGSLRFLLKQAEAMIESLRDERKMTANVREAIAIVRDDEEAEGGADEAKAA